jgi:hypothetical protein
MGGLELEASGLATVMGRLDACELTWGGDWTLGRRRAWQGRNGQLGLYLGCCGRGHTVSQTDRLVFLLYFSFQG